MIKAAPKKLKKAVITDVSKLKRRNRDLEKRFNEQLRVNHQYLAEVDRLQKKTLSQRDKQLSSKIARIFKMTCFMAAGYIFAMLITLGLIR